MCYTKLLYEAYFTCSLHYPGKLAVRKTYNTLQFSIYRIVSYVYICKKKPEKELWGRCSHRESLFRQWGIVPFLVHAVNSRGTSRSNSSYSSPTFKSIGKWNSTYMNKYGSYLKISEKRFALHWWLKKVTTVKSESYLNTT